MSLRENACPSHLAAIGCQLESIRRWLLERQAYALAQQLEPVITAVTRARDEQRREAGA